MWPPGTTFRYVLLYSKYVHSCSVPSCCIPFSIISCDLCTWLWSDSNSVSLVLPKSLACMLFSSNIESTTQFDSLLLFAKIWYLHENTLPPPLRLSPPLTSNHWSLTLDPILTLPSAWTSISTQLRPNSEIQGPANQEGAAHKLKLSPFCLTLLCPGVPMNSKYRHRVACP